MDVAVARAMPHRFEEPCISGTRGSGTVFLKGCSLQCTFCQNYSISHMDDVGEGLTLDALCETVSGLLSKGVHNLSFVTGTHYAYQIADALRIVRPDVPVVWNSGGYERPETVRMLGDLIDVWLPDLKFAENEPAARVTAVSDYADAACASILAMCEMSGEPEYDDEGILRRGVLLRHLCMPGMTGHSKRTLDWIKANLGERVIISLMRQYVPNGPAAKNPPLDRRLTDREYQRVFDYMMNLGFNKGYTQEADSAAEGFVPAFDGEGVLNRTDREVTKP